MKDTQMSLTVTQYSPTLKSRTQKENSSICKRKAVTFKEANSRLMAKFSTEILQARREQRYVCNFSNRKSYQSWTSSLVMLTVRNSRQWNLSGTSKAVKIIRLTLQNVFKGVLNRKAKDR